MSLSLFNDKAFYLFCSLSSFNDKVFYPLKNLLSFNNESLLSKRRQLLNNKGHQTTP
jgi:hypothetical protein